MDERLIEAVKHGRSDELRSLLAGVENLDEEFPYRSHGQPDYRRTTLLMTAAESPDSSVSVMKLLFDAGANIDHAILRTGTALCRACSFGEPERVQFLIESGATVWPIKEIGRNFLLSPEEESTRVAKLMQWTPDEVGSQTPDSIPLYMAARSGSAECVELILQAGFPAKFRNKYGQESESAMHYATGEEVVSVLLREGLIDQRSENPYYDPLHQKLSLEDFAAAKALIQSIPISERQERLNKEFVLFCGFDYVSIDVLKFLVEQGSEPANESITGLGNALHWAVWRGSGDEIEISGEQIDVLKYLVDLGAEVNLTVEGGTTPLHNAVYGDWGNPTATKFLIDHGAELNAVDDQGQSALFLACERRELPCIQLLLDAGADRSLVANDGSTALSIALRNLEWKREKDDVEEIAKATRIVELLQS